MSTPSEKLQSWADHLCDKYSHFGEYMKQECIDAGIPPHGKVLKMQVSAATLIAIYAGRRGVGPEASKAYGNVLGVPHNFYQRIYELFKAEKARREKL